ncbi:hypothetical protein PHYPSEUDO_015003 [Phytophthora pseudosyringae]|uniref:Uncharacterized protein n=1 Tax=Phytophthora pseudosyringae TaxID=221518 RepID=A0A8T1WHA6_9STRA|nr:hypothetical protein PHYPSEUDO_015003 [Phytophthora pseudosyringae]
MAAALVGAMLPFGGDGVRLGAFDSIDKDAAEQKQLTDRYNSISGGLTVLLMKPLDVFLSMLITIAFVSLNVQAVTGRIHPRIMTSDLVMEDAYDYDALRRAGSQNLDANGRLTTTWNTSFRESSSGNSVFNTFLRNLFIAREEAPSWCNTVVDFPFPFKECVARYGFPARFWQQYALSKALESTELLSIRMNTADSDLPSDADIPMNVSVATNLVVYSMLVSNAFLGWWSGVDDVWGPATSVDTSESLSMADYFNLVERSSDNATLLSDIHKLIVGYYNKAENASTTDELAKLEFTHINMSDTVNFDALTIQVPTQKFGTQEDNSSSTNPFYQGLFPAMCNPEACLVADSSEYSEEGAKITIHPRVQALAICLNPAGGEELVVDFSYFEVDEVLQACEQHSNSSMIIVSVGKRVEGDSFEAGASAASQVVNARVVYSLTVGRLSWTVKDLADVYDAECGSDAGCSGIRFPLERTEGSSTKDMLLASNNSSPMNLLSPINMNRLSYSIGDSQWKTLASKLEEPNMAELDREARPFFIALPRNFKKANGSFTALYESPGQCEKAVDDYLNDMERNHLYIEHTLQPAYTTGLYFIFQNAVVLKDNASAASAQAPLAFSGKFHEIALLLLWGNSVLACVGCMFMVIGGITIALLGKHGEGKLLEHGTARTVVEAIANRDKFPPCMLRLQSQDATTGQFVDVSLESLCVGNVVLVSESQAFVVSGSLSSRPCLDQVKPYQASIA